MCWTCKLAELLRESGSPEEDGGGDEDEGPDWSWLDSARPDYGLPPWLFESHDSASANIAFRAGKKKLLGATPPDDSIPSIAGSFDE